MFFVVVNLLLCKKIENKLNDKLFQNKPINFSIKKLVKDFSDDKNIIEIKGIQVHDLFYKEYFVYIGEKKRVLNGINKISSTNDFSEDCRLSSKNEFYSSIIKSKKNEYTSFFWNFEKLKNVEIYTCIKGPNRHFIVFDKVSDTVYHRVDEIRD